MRTATAPASTEHDAFLTTGDMARRSSNTLRTVRFYEEEGILRPARRSDGGHRFFDEAELERLMLVSDLRAAGLSLEEIKDLLDVKTTGGAPSAAERAATLLSERMQQLREKLATLTKLEADLEATVSALRKGGVDGHAAEPPRALRVLWGAGAGAAPTAP